MDYSMKSARTTNYSKGKKVKLDSSFIPAHKWISHGLRPKCEKVNIRNFRKKEWEYLYGLGKIKISKIKYKKYKI